MGMSKKRRAPKESFIFFVNPQSNFLTAEAHYLFGDPSVIETFICFLLTGFPRSKVFTVVS